MPSFIHRGARIHYETFGQGFPLLTFAPKGMQSAISVWQTDAAPIDVTREFADVFQVIAMDQRNADTGQSRAPITAQDGWDDYTADHLAVLDHLGAARCHVFGQCIGGTFIFNLIRHQPERVAAAVIAQPIGRNGPMPAAPTPRFQEWMRAAAAEHPEATTATFEAVSRNLYGPGFVFSVDRAFVAALRTPCLLLAGNDDAHPREISDELAALIPGCEFIPEWKTGAALQAARRRVRAFLLEHTPRPDRPAGE